MKAIDGFRANIARARELGQLYRALSAITTEALRAEDLLRSQIVIAVSALDHFVHEIVRQEMVAIYEGSRPTVPGFDKFQVSLAEAKASIPTSSSQWVNEAIRQSHSYLAFQHPDKIADAIRLIHDAPLWPALETRLVIPAKDIKERLKLVVDRRNKIAHEADIDPSYPGARWPISYLDATSATDFLEKIVEAIHDEVA
jgi:hypothetical protein